jgi:4'-phosphopantetheinyl transferase
MTYHNANCLMIPPLNNTMITTSYASLQSMSIAIDNCQLQHDCIDIWQFSLANEPAYAKSILNDDEQKRAQRFYFTRHQRRFTVARAFMRLILAHYLNTSPKLLNFSYNSYGKPALTPYQELDFNLSHSGDLGLLAVGQRIELGIDVEFFSARPYQDIASHLFSATELQGLQQLPALLKPLGFFHVWAQKEAFIKASGLGLAYPTKKFSVPILPPADTQLIDSLINQKRQLLSFMPGPACCAALCYNRLIHSIRKIILLS